MSEDFEDPTEGGASLSELRISDIQTKRMLVNLKKITDQHQAMLIEMEKRIIELTQLTQVMLHLIQAISIASANPVQAGIILALSATSTAVIAGETG